MKRQGVALEARADVLRREHADLVLLLLHVTSRYAVAYGETMKAAA